MQIFRTLKVFSLTKTSTPVSALLTDCSWIRRYISSKITHLEAHNAQGSEEQDTTRAQHSGP